MTEVDRILDQYDRAVNGDAWHGDSVWKILDGISAEQAAARANPQRHTIWELVAHMTFWETQVFRRLNNLPDMPTELNFPAMPEPTTRKTGKPRWATFDGPISSSVSAFPDSIALDSIRHLEAAINRSISRSME